MIIAMFFGDKIIKERYSVGVVHERGINNGTEQGAVKYIFLFFCVRPGSPSSGHLSGSHSSNLELNSCIPNIRCLEEI